MIAKQHLTARQIGVIVFFTATILLLLGLFLTAVRPVIAQTGASGTSTVGVISTNKAGVPVSGSMNRNSIDLNQLYSFAVVDRDGNPIGTVNSLVMDLRNASVCQSSSSSVSGGSSATSMPTVMSTSSVSGSSNATAAVPNTGSVYTGLKDCNLNNASQAAGSVAYVVVDRSGTVSSTSGSSVGTTSSMSSTSVATSDVSGGVSATSAVTSSNGSGTSVGGTAVSSGNLVPVPWRYIRINLDQHTLIVDVTQNALNNAPSFSGSNPDFFGTEWQQNFSRFWNNSANVSTGVPVTGGTSSTTAPSATSIVGATSVPTSAVVATTEPVMTSTLVATSTVAPTETSAVAATSISTATSAATATSSVPATVQAPGVNGTPTALVPVTGIDIGQVQEAAAAQRRMLIDVGVVGVGLVLLALGIVLKTGKK